MHDENDKMSMKIKGLKQDKSGFQIELSMLCRNIDNYVGAGPFAREMSLNESARVDQALIKP